MLFTIVNRILQNRDKTEDLVQDIFIKVYQQLSRYNQQAKFSTWLYRIAYNESISYLRREKRAIPIQKIDYSLCEDEVYEEIDGVETEVLLKHLNTLLKRMPQEDALLITLFYLKNLTITDVSEITNLTVSNVKVRLHRIRKYMHVELKKMAENE